MARSGSTLLRFLLDAHPALACPPETRLPWLCGQLAGVWSLLDGTPLGDDPATDAGAVPEPALAGVRRLVDDLTGEYLRRRRKRRYCDKSLGVAPQVPMLVKMFPGARFLCLYRHPMDMIASGIEACPWGLNGFGFDAYAASWPGNSVQALAHFWSDNATSILAAEEQFPERCHRVFYEDMVTDPETVAAGIFDFLGVEPAPGISHACFSQDREPLGPADFKIWHTSEIKPDSVGRGWHVPAGQMRSGMRDKVNELAAKLGYLRVGDDWGNLPSPPALRQQRPGASSTEAVPSAGGSALLLPAGQRALSRKIREGVARLAADPTAAAAFRQRWGRFGSETFLLTASQRARMPLRLRVDLAALTVGIAPLVASADTATAQWELIAPDDAWLRYLSGELNPSSAIRHRQLRYAEASEGVPGGVRVRLSLLGDLLGTNVWTRPGTTADEADQESVVTSATPA